jgi:cbb3-type cytochrome oxidase cytochrome c subunit
MSRLSLRGSGWRGVSLVAITYVYFLIFAQFAFLKRLADLGIADTHLKIVMAAMAAAGILFSLLAARPLFSSAPRLTLQAALCTCGLAALLTLLPLSLLSSIAVACLIGAGLGILTVTLVANLNLWLGSGNSLLKVGLGTGLGYFICNLPSLFTAAPTHQAITAATLTLLGILIASASSLANSPCPEMVQSGSLPRKPKSRVNSYALNSLSNFDGEGYLPQEVLPPSRRATSFPRVLLCFTALVWLDSAAFFIIQNTPALKSGTWEGTAHLWINGLLHLSAALLAAWLLRRRGLAFVLGLAVLALACACLLLLDPSRALLASFFYPIGVSLYSVALVAYPSLLAPAASSSDRAHNAGLIYGIAGWFGSAMGIGMGQHLGQVPVPFVLLAIALVLGSHLFDLLRRHSREAATTAAVLLTAFGIHRAILASNAASHATPGPSSIERGRQVYISEGCINCHSQYVRPNTPDVLMWGPAESIEELRSQHPPLIGNRRQGPDLSQVGGRRSPLWLKAHFYNPREVSHASFMPSYAYLFRNSSRGDDLIAYLTSSKSPEYAQHIQVEQSWQPSTASVSAADASEGEHLFHAYCATCHESAGLTRQAWRTSFRRLPPDLQTGPWSHLPTTDSKEQRLIRLVQIVKFGIPGTDMPGHEYLPDRDISSIALWLNRSMIQPGQLASTHNLSRGNQ